MSEEMHSGPLDIARRFTAQATKYEDLLTRCGMSNPESYVEIQNKLDELNSKNPLVEQEVIGHGTVLTYSVEGDDVKQLALPPSVRGILRPSPDPRDEPTMNLWTPPPQEQAPVVGDYLGLHIKAVYDPDMETTSLRIVHAVRTGVSDQWNVDMVDRLTAEHMSYLCLDESDIQATMPVLAHSYEDLARDPIFDACLEIIHSKDKPARIIGKIGKLANNYFARGEAEPSFQNQLVSWFNSTGLLSGMSVRTRYIAIASRYDFLLGEDIHTDQPRTDLVMVSPLFDLAPGYIILSNGTVEHTETNELYATAPLREGSEKCIFTPLKRIIGAELITSDS